MSLQRKLFTAFFGLIIIPLFILGSIAYHFISNLTETRYSEQTEITLRALLRNVDQVFREMHKVTDSTIASKAIQEAMQNLQPSDIDTKDYMKLNEIQRSFRELLVNHPSISYAFMYTLRHGDTHKLFSKASFSPLPFNEFKELEIYQEVIARDGLPVWIGPYENSLLTGNDQVFTLARVVKDLDTLENKGILLVQIHTFDIESIFRYFRYRDKDTTYMIVNADGLILFDSSGALEKQKLEELALDRDRDRGTSYESVRLDFQGVDSIVSTIHFGNYENWRLVSVTPWTIISGEFKRIAILIAIAIGICILFASLFILFFTQRISRSIVETVRVMREVERGNLGLRVRVTGNDETGLLLRGFNRLLHRLDELIDEVKEQQERKRKAEIAALQSQIKPHFLFNTLESINILAIQNQGKKVSQMVSKLGNILRISIQQQEIITIEQELEHVRSYLDIQKYRFEDLFEYEIHAPEAIRTHMTLKLSLQPLIENCIQHGFEGIQYLGFIRIEITEDDDRIYFMIEDNGHGIHPEQLAKFKYMSNDVHMIVNTPEVGERRGIGISNVADRIRMCYGSPYGLMICSSPGFGTTIKMTIPK